MDAAAFDEAANAAIAMDAAWMSETHCQCLAEIPFDTPILSVLSW